VARLDLVKSAGALP